MTIATKVRTGTPPAPGSPSGLLLTACPSPPVCPGLRLPTSSADTRFDTSDSEEREDTANQQCCPCHSPVGQSQPNVETVSFQKKFENFLHNSIILPRWDTLDGGGPAGGGGAEKGGRELSVPLCPTLSPGPLGKSPPLSTRSLLTGELMTVFTGRESAFLELLLKCSLRFALGGSSGAATLPF